jgi:hypothetical protein
MLAAMLRRHSVGDITPVEGVPVHVKHELEQQAMDSFLNEMLGGPGNVDARERFRSLWNVSERFVAALWRLMVNRSTRIVKRQNQSW